MDNPIRKYRGEVSRRGMAHNAGVTPSAIRQVEEGQFVSIPIKIHAYFKKFYPGEYKEEKVNEEYKLFIAIKRAGIKFNYKPFALEKVKEPFTFKQHPLKEYMDQIKVKPSAFCAAICVPKSSFFKYIQADQRSMPITIKTALADCGMSYKGISALDKAGEHYYDLMHDRIPS